MNLPVGSVDSSTMPGTPMTLSPKIDHQIVSPEENKGETILFPTPADGQALRPAATATVPSAELPPGAGVTETKPEERAMQAASSAGVVTAGAMVTAISDGSQLECTIIRRSKSEAILESMQELAAVAPERDSVPAPP